MKRSKPGVKYQWLAFAVPFIKEIKEHIKADQKYRSVTDFVREATREKMIRDKQMLNLKPTLDPIVSQFQEIGKLQDKIMKLKKGMITKNDLKIFVSGMNKSKVKDKKVVENGNARGLS